MTFWLRTALTWVLLGFGVYSTGVIASAAGAADIGSILQGIAGTVVFACAALLFVGGVVGLLRVDGQPRYERQHRHRNRRRRRP